MTLENALLKAVLEGRYLQISHYYRLAALCDCSTNPVRYQLVFSYKAMDQAEATSRHFLG